MSKIAGFFDSLKKSTKITMLSCGSFVVLTLLILAFFIMFPITPSEKIMANIGRGENIFQDDGNGPVQNGVQQIETTVSTAKTTGKATTTKASTTRSKTSFTITITTGSGFMWNGRIPTGGIPGYTETTTTAVSPDEPYEDPSNPDHQGTTNTDPTGYVDPNTGITDPDPSTGGDDPNPNGNTGGGGSEPTPVVTPDTGGGDTGTW